MTTSIELEGEKVSAWLFKKTGENFDRQNKVVIADQVSDEPGIPHQTPFGEISFTFSSVENGGSNLSPVMVLNCSRSKVLQTVSRRCTRIININREGFGLQQLDKGVSLIINTEADLESYRGVL